MVRAAGYLQMSHLGDVSISQYMKWGVDFHAFALRCGLPVAPTSQRLLVAYVIDWVGRGFKPSSLHARFCGIRWYLQLKFGSSNLFLDARDRPGYDAVLRLMRGCQRIIGRPVKKSAPLYQGILDLLFDLISRRRQINLWEVQVVTLFQLLHDFIQRPCELLSESVSWKSVQFLPQVRVIIFHYTAHNDPKAHKSKQAPYACITTRSKGYHALLWYARLLPPRSANALLFPFVSLQNAVSHRQGLTSMEAISRLRKLLCQVGVKEPGAYTSYCARRGGVSDRAGAVPERILQLQGHWSPSSSTMQTEYDSVSLQRRMEYF